MPTTVEELVRKVRSILESIFKIKVPEITATISMEDMETSDVEIIDTRGRFYNNNDGMYGDKGHNMTNKTYINMRYYK